MYVLYVIRLCPECVETYKTVREKELLAVYNGDYF